MKIFLAGATGAIGTQLFEQVFAGGLLVRETPVGLDGGQRAFGQVRSRSRHADELADLYIWLATKMPYRNSEETEGFGFVSPSRSLDP